MRQARELLKIISEKALREIGANIRVRKRTTAQRHEPDEFLNQLLRGQVRWISWEE